MITADQSDVIQFLSSPSTHGGATVETIETHASIVFLAGGRAWKLKRAVRYDYLDFSTLERRRVLCEAEVRINRRAAPTLYRGVVAVTRELDGTLSLGGTGAPVEWVIEMTRFAQEDLFDRLASRGALDRDLMRPLAAAIARFHAGAEPRRDHGGRSGMAWAVEGNLSDFAEHGAELDPSVAAALSAEARAALDRGAPLLDARRDAGYVRQCHGDLHLRNIVLLNGQPTLFDAVEFNDRIACIDLLYDLAFLLMDLWRRGLPGHANAVLNGYLAAGPRDPALGALTLLPLFLSCRAAVRAKTSVAAAALERDRTRGAELRATALEYLRMALALVRPAGPRLLAVGGFSGSGKSSLAYGLAPSIGAPPGAVVLRSDEARKRMCGVSELDRLGPDTYTEEMSTRVYERLNEEASTVIRQGHGAIVDAVFARAEEREAIRRIADSASVPFTGIWLEAPEDVLIGRVQRRQLDASDADAGVIGLQLARDVGDIDWHRVDAASGSETVLQRVKALLQV